MIAHPQPFPPSGTVCAPLQPQLQHVLHRHGDGRCLCIGKAVLQRFLQILAAGMLNAHLARGLRLVLCDIGILAALDSLVDAPADRFSGVIGIREDDDPTAISRFFDQTQRFLAERKTVGLDRITVKILLKHAGIMSSFHDDHFLDLHHTTPLLVGIIAQNPVFLNKYFTSVSVLRPPQTAFWAFCHRSVRFFTSPDLFFT